MANITFIFYDVLKQKNSFSIPLATLSACLKKENHKVNLTTVRFNEEINKKTFLKKLIPADIFGFSALSGSFPRLKVLFRWIKEEYPKSLIVIGGPHAILKPEEVIETEGVDAVCLGEGENCMVELANKVSKRAQYLKTKNFWFKNKNRIIKNERLPLIEDLNKLPFLDRDLFNYREITDYKDGKQIVVMASRGCPYNCSYCANHKIRTLYPNKHRWLRTRSVDSVIKELKEIQKQFGNHELVKFVDDTIVQDKKWFEELVRKYPKEIGIQITCQIRPNEGNIESMRGLKKLGVKRLEMGIESGNDFIRTKIMNRHITNKATINTFNLARKFNIETISFNILGLPFETLEMMLDTVKVNALSNPSWAKVLYFQPFPNTEIHELCLKYGFLKGEIKETLFEGSALESPYVTKDQLDFVYTCFRFLIKLYKIKFMWKIWDAIITFRFFPHRLFVRLSPLLNPKETFATKLPRLHKAVRKIIK